MTFLRTALNAQKKARGEQPLDAAQFLRLVRAKAKTLNITDEMLKRPAQAGFSGGEKKRAEVLQMSLFEPGFAVLDETDLGLDIDALRLVSEGVNALRRPDRAMLVITHYQRLLARLYRAGRGARARRRTDRQMGGRELALELEKSGYDEIVKAAA